MGFSAYINFIINVLPGSIKFIELGLDCINLNFSILTKKLTISIITYFKKSTLTRFNTLTELTVVDNPSNQNRFTLFLILTSVEFNLRLVLNILLNANVSYSIAQIYQNSNWQERETAEMFGIYFTDNTDLRRLLTDYGFRGFPLRKDFPLTGYLEARYDDELQRILYEPVELSQEFRIFTITNPWEKLN